MKAAAPSAIRFSHASVEMIEAWRPRSFLNLTARTARSLASSGVRFVRLAAITAATCFRLSSPIPTLATLHPSYLLRMPAQKRFAWSDMLALREKVETLGLSIPSGDRSA